MNKYSQLYRYASAAGLFFASLFIPLSANASLLNDSITGHLSQGPNTGVPIVSDFSSPAIVGPGTEFTSTTGTDVFGQTWVIDVDVDSSSFIVSFLEATGNINANIASATAIPYFVIDLGDLDWLGGPGGITAVVLDSFTAPIWGDRHSGLTFTSNSISVAFEALEHGASYVFSINPAQVPAPATLLLLGLGMAGIGYRRREPKRKAD